MTLNPWVDSRAVAVPSDFTISQQRVGVAQATHSQVIGRYTQARTVSW